MDAGEPTEYKSKIPSLGISSGNDPWRVEEVKLMERINMKMKAVLTAGMLAALAQYASASVIVQPIGATSPNPVQRDVANSYNGNGLSDSSIVETGDSVPAVYPTHNNAAGSQWQAKDVSANQVTITFDLGGQYDLTGFHLWNGCEYWSGTGDETDKGVKEATVLFSTDNGNNWTSMGAMTFARGLDNNAYTGEDYAAVMNGATHVRFDVLSNWSADGQSGQTGIAEVRFVAIPEPATLGLIGVFGVGTIFIRRRLMM